LAARADEQAKELEARWPNLAEDAVKLVAMDEAENFKLRNCGACAPRSPADPQ
jgi:hypothetical protein